jgi:hypothetical protein
MSVEPSARETGRARTMRNRNGDEPDRTAPTVRVSDYPQLRLIAWSLRSDAIVTEADALGIYERNWRHVEALDDREAHFVQHLVETCGGGRRLV